MDRSEKRQPTRWDSKGKRLGKRVTPRDKEAIRKEYEMRMAQGEARDDILYDLEERLGKERRQIERYIHDARQADEKRVLSLAQRISARIDPRQSVHERAMREMADSLGKEVALPPVPFVFTVSRDGQYWYPHALSWKLCEGGRVQVFLRLEDDEDTQMLYHSLMEHLSAPGFSSVAPDIAQWKKRATDYLEACYSLLSHVTAEVEAVLGTVVAPAYAVQAGVFPTFPLSICHDAVERARGMAASLSFSYATEKLGDRLLQLRFGADAIAAAASPAELERLQNEHVDLRNKYAGSERARTAAAIAEEAIHLQTRIRDRLDRFRLSSPLHGYCSLCHPPAG